MICEKKSMTCTYFNNFNTSHGNKQEEDYTQGYKYNERVHVIKERKYICM